MKRRITVTGQGKASFRPDTALVRAFVSARDVDYERAVSETETRYETLRGDVMAAGFKKSALKTESLSVQPRFESDEDKNGKSARRFAGYECRHALKLELEADSALLAKLLAGLSSSRAKPEFSVDFSLRDRKKAEAELLAAAAKDAKYKAEALCEASGTALGALLKVSAEDGGGAVFASARCMSAQPDIAPDDIELSACAVFVWELKELE